MTSDIVKIPKDEYERLKSLEKVEWEVLKEFKESLEELKEDKYIEC
jgi:hypothetical protein